MHRGISGSHIDNKILAPLVLDLPASNTLSSDVPQIGFVLNAVAGAHRLWVTVGGITASQLIVRIALVLRPCHPTK